MIEPSEPHRCRVPADTDLATSGPAPDREV